MFRKPQGYARLYSSPGAVPIEADTFTCAHCQRIVSVLATARPEDAGGLCKQCSDDGKTSHGLICRKCYGVYQKHGCLPFLRKLEAAERRHQVLVSMGLAEDMAPRARKRIEEDKAQRKRLDALLY